MVAGETLLHHSASVMSSTRRTETPARYISMSASSTLLSRRRYRSMMAVSKDTPLSRGIWSVTSQEVGGEVAVIMAAAVAPDGPRCVRSEQPASATLRLLFQQFVQRFLHAAADQFLDLPLDNFLIQLYNFLGYSLLSPFECLCGNFILPEPASYVLFYAVFNLRNLLYLII